MRKHNSFLFSLFASLLGFVIFSLSASAQTTAPYEWTWIGGSNTLGSYCGEYGLQCGQAGEYGTLETPAAGNIPGSRAGAISWTDSSGNLWLFGGGGYDDKGNLGGLNDVWEFNPSTNEWAWMGGSSTMNCIVESLCFGTGVNGTPGTPAAGNIPQGRSFAASWTDSGGHLWLFGGNANNSTNFNDDQYLNDLWEFYPSTNEWALMGSINCGLSGSLVSCPGVYGTLGEPAIQNIPGGREFASSWTDGNGNLWLFGAMATMSMAIRVFLMTYGSLALPQSDGRGWAEATLQATTAVRWESTEH